MRGTKSAIVAQRVTSLAKALALLVLVAACFIFARPRARRRSRRRRARGDDSTLRRVPARGAGGDLHVRRLVGPIYFSEELDDPARQIPRSMFYGLLERRGDLPPHQHRVRVCGADVGARRLAARGGTVAKRFRRER